MTYNSQVGNYTYPTNGIRPHAVTQAGANSYVYDANGNMTSGAGRTITPDYDNRPKTITKSGVTATFVYDYAGQRIKKTVGTTTTVYIGKLYICTGSTCSKYIFANGNRIAVKASSGSRYYYHTDHLGSSSIITDSAGTKVEELYYYPYGGTRINQGSINVKHKFTGQEEDAETGSKGSKGSPIKRPSVKKKTIPIGNFNIFPLFTITSMHDTSFASVISLV
jgi:uncharacterized protein RhaS with RHS repeats